MKKKKNVAEPLPSNPGPQLIVDEAPFEYVEAHKAFRTNFNFVTANSKSRKIVVTSTLRDEGKSSLSANLAISLAQAGSKVLLIDADLRNPSLHRYLHMATDTKKGTSNLLSGDVKVGECLIKTEYGVDVIAGGPIPQNPVELIASDAMRDLLNIAAQHYDYVICDAPPVGIITDAAALCTLCDGVLFVIRQNFANKARVRDAIKKLMTVNAKILGTVMTQYMIPQNAAKRYGYGYRYRNEYKYGYGYGYYQHEDGEQS